MMSSLISCLFLATGAASGEIKKSEIVDLEKVLNNEPDNSSTVYALACQYKSQDQLQKALDLFEKRIAMGGCENEIYHSLYLIGMIQEALDMPLEAVSNSYCKAFVYCPDRAEPIFRLAHYLNKKQNFPLSYVLSKLALTIAKPTAGIDIEASIYDFELLAEFAQSAFCLGKIEESRQAYQKLMAKEDLPEPIKQSIESTLGHSQIKKQP